LFRTIMISRWLIFFRKLQSCGARTRACRVETRLDARRCLACVVQLVAALAISAQAATVTGEVKLANSSNSSVNRHKDFSGVAVGLSAPDGAGGQLARKHVQMLQKDKKFTPHVLVIETGTTVDFPNADPIFHNAFSNYNGQIFDTALYPPGSSKSIRFRRA